jgi:N-acetylneuraminic acid mutarotase
MITFLMICFLTAWTPLPDMPEAKGSFGCEVLGDNLYIVCGCTDRNIHIDTAYRYSIKEGKWEQIASTGLAVQSPVLRAVNGRLFLIGGYDSTKQTKYNNVFEYDLFLNIWKPKSPMPTAREDMGSAVLDDKIYVFGGITNPGHKYLDIIEVYDTSLDLWETIEPMPDNRCLGDFGAYWNDCIYIAGGTNTMSGYSKYLHPAKSVWRYDKLKGWSELSDMPFPRCYSEAEIVNGYLFVAGGCVKGVFDYTDSVVFYDIEKDVWSTGPSLPYSATSIGLASCGDDLYVCGGCNDDTRKKYVSKFYKLNISGF